MDQRTRKLMTMHKVLYPRDDVERLYLSRREGRRGLASIEDSVNTSIQRLEDIIEKRGRTLITATRTTRNNTNDTGTSRTTITSKKTWEEKQLYGRFKRLTKDISLEKIWTWLREGNLKGESLLIAAQNITIRTNHIKARINKMLQNSRSRLCGERDETINHIISECSKLALKEYKTMHDWVGKVIHREQYKKLKFGHTNERYIQSPESVLENETHKLLWDFEIKRITKSRPDD